MRSMSASVIARGVAQPGANGSAEGAIVGQGSGAPAPRASPPSQGRLTDPLRPAWASLDADLGRADAVAMVDHARERVLAGSE